MKVIRDGKVSWWMEFYRRIGWMLENTSLAKLFNLGLIGLQFATKRQKSRAWPAVLKIDISPLCNLKCSSCIHASPNGNPVLENQEFRSEQKMSVEQFGRIIDEVKGKTSAVSLYWLGDPLVHPDLDEMCSIAWDAGLNIHVSSNFSFNLSDERVRSIAKSGLTHLTVCVDGLSQEAYEKTRVGGNIDRVLWNLERICQFKRELGRTYPKVEVQYIKFQHNVDELEDAINLFRKIGVDQVSTFWGNYHTYTDRDPGTYTVGDPLDRKLFPRCYWPYFSMIIKYNGDVIPCCEYRYGAQYGKGADRQEDQRVMGNVFETSVREVWNSQAFLDARKYVSNPKQFNTESSKKHFCHGCPRVFDTDQEKNLRLGSDYKFEELYTINGKNIPVRIRVPNNQANTEEEAELQSS